MKTAGTEKQSVALRNRRALFHDAPALAGLAARMELTDADFARFQRLIYAETGIWMTPNKKSLISGRLARRLRELDLLTMRRYFEFVLENVEERQQMFNLVSTHETHFFREPRQFEFLAHEVLPAWTSQAETGQRTRSLRVWSAGCSTGEEPYSIAMLLLDRLPPSEGWQLEILATDLATDVLAKAAQAVWPLEKASEIPPQFLRRFMLKGTGPREGTMKAGQDLRAAVRFRQLNLNDDAYDVQGKFDLIFCRNVLIYFDQRSKTRVVERLFSHLAAEGLLFLGHAENMSGFSHLASGVFTNVYGHAHARHESAVSQAGPRWRRRKRLGQPASYESDTAR